MDWLHSTWGSLEDLVVAAGRMEKCLADLVLAAMVK